MSWSQRWATVMGGFVLAVATGCAATTAPPPEPTQTPSPNATVTVTATATPSEATLQGALAIVSPAVVRFDVSVCGGFGSGTGFLVGEDLVATAAHVVGDVVQGRITRAKKSSGFDVVAVDERNDVALVWSQAPLGGRPVELSTDLPSVGQPVATVGYSLGGNVSFHEGVVNGLDRKSVIEGRTLVGLIEHSAEALPGDSGAPLIDVEGHVVGIQDAGIEIVAGQRLAVSAGVIEDLVDGWDTSRAPVVEEADCGIIVDSEGEEYDLEHFTDPEVGAWNTLLTRAAALNRGDWSAAASQWAVPRDPDEIKAGSDESQLSDLMPQDMWRENGRPVVWATMVTTQPEGMGPTARPLETCTVWSVEYTFKKKNGLWLLTGSRRHNGEEASRPCQSE